jgi:carbamoyl-phosphate synthase large subunit
MRDLTVLLTAVGTLGQGPSMIKALKMVEERHVRVVGTDISTYNAATNLCDSTYTVPAGSSPDYVDEMLKIAKKESIDVIIPQNAVPEALALAKRAKEFEEAGTIIHASRPEVIEIANDKGKTLDFLRQQSLPCARYKRITANDDVNEIVRDLGYPEKAVVVKPTLGAGNRGLRILTASPNYLESMFYQKPSSFPTMTLDDYLAVLSKVPREKVPEMVAMEYLPGDEYTVYLLAKERHAFYDIPLRRWVPTAGMSIIAEAVKNDEVIELTKKILSLLNLEFNVNMQLKYSSEGSPLLYEINPRLSATTILCVAAGVNLPYYGAKLAIGEEVPKVPIRYGTKMFRFMTEVYVHDESTFMLPYTYGKHVEVKTPTRLPAQEVS